MSPRRTQSAIVRRVVAAAEMCPAHSRRFESEIGFVQMKGGIHKCFEICFHLRCGSGGVQRVEKRRAGEFRPRVSRVGDEFLRVGGSNDGGGPIGEKGEEVSWSPDVSSSGSAYGLQRRQKDRKEGSGEEERRSTKRNDAKSRRTIGGRRQEHFAHLKPQSSHSRRGFHPSRLPQRSHLAENAPSPPEKKKKSNGLQFPDAGALDCTATGA